VNERLGRRKKEAQAGLDFARSFAAPGALDDPALRLGAIAAGLARGGADKLTLLLSPKAALLGPGIEEIVARSTGKKGRGVVPIVGEPPGRKEAYGRDRLFVAIALDGEEYQVPHLAEAGHPMLHWTLPAPLEPAGELARWATAALTMARVLEVDPAAAPEIAAGEERARLLRESGAPPAEPSLRAQGLALFAEPVHAQILRRAAGTLGPLASVSPAGWIAAHLALADPGDYVALLGYLLETDLVQGELSSVQGAIRNATKLACTSSFGPGYLRGAGQLHKGGPNTGIFLVLTRDAGDVEARADLEELQSRGRRALRIHVEDGDSQKIIETLHAATKLLSRSP